MSADKTIPRSVTSSLRGATHRWALAGLACALLAAPAAADVAQAKRTLTRLSALTNRGQTARPAELAQGRAAMDELQLAGAGQGAWQPYFVEEWELIFSDLAPFRASPFFMALGKALDGFRPGAAERSLLAHRMATSVGEIGRVKWLITPDSLTSDVELRVGLLPGVPAQLSGSVRTEASLARVGPASSGFVCEVERTRVLGAALTVVAPDVANGGETSALRLAEPLQQLVAGLAFPSGALLGGQQVRLEPLFVDEELMLVRCQDIDHAGFVFLRTPPLDEQAADEAAL